MSALVVLVFSASPVRLEEQQLRHHMRIDASGKNIEEAPTRLTGFAPLASSRIWGALGPCAGADVVVPMRVSSLLLQPRPDYVEARWQVRDDCEHTPKSHASLHLCRAPQTPPECVANARPGHHSIQHPVHKHGGCSIGDR